MMQCLADPNLLKPYIILGPFKFPMQFFAQKDRNDLLQRVISGVPGEVGENTRGCCASWGRMIGSRNGHTCLQSEARI